MNNDLFDNQGDGVLYVSGTRGYSAYEIAVQHGFEGTEEEWLASLIGPQGEAGTPFGNLTPSQKAELKGDTGKSAYEVAVENGFIGTESEWVNSFLTPDGYVKNNEDIIVKKPYCFSTVAEMISKNLKAGDAVLTLGYYSENDGGSAEYIIVDNDSLIDDGGRVIELNNGLKAVLIIRNELHSRQFGIKGDGVTDETTKLSNFYSLSLDADKVLDKGIYIISSTLVIKSKWRQDSSSNHNNGLRSFVFTNATIKYQGEADGCSVIFCNMFNSRVQGFAIDRTSTTNYVDIVGAWHVSFNDCDFPNLGMRKNTDIIDSLNLVSSAVQHIKINDCFIKGDITINPGSSWCNAIFFNGTTVYSQNKDYCLNLLGASGKHDIVFTNCDLSYSTKAIVNVPQTQIGGCALSFYGVYFDSGTPMFENDDNKDIICTYINCKNPSGIDEEVFTPRKISETAKINNGSAIANILPSMNMNLAVNGNYQNGVNTPDAYSYIFGPTSAAVTKTKLTGCTNTLYGYGQKLLFGGENVDKSIQIKTIDTVPFTSRYVLGVRCKIVSGSCNSIKLSLGNYTCRYMFNTLPVGEEILLTNNKIGVKNAGDSFGTFYFSVENNNLLEIEVYEVILNAGNVVIPNLPLQSSCIISSS